MNATKNLKEPSDNDVVTAMMCDIRDAMSAPTKREADVILCRTYSQVQALYAQQEPINLNHDAFVAQAKAAGWDYDISPTTEMSSEVWWRHGGTFALKREEDLRDELCPPNGEERA